MREILLIIALIISLTALGQQKGMKALNELKNNQDPAWPIVQQWIDNATNSVEILLKDPHKADSVLYQTQVTTRSPMGSIIYETGGLLIDNGWIRILGSGSERLSRNITGWNKDKSYKENEDRPAFLLIADDVLGGFFAINAGGLDQNNIGKVYYFAPDNLTWENTELGYSDFLSFCFNGNLSEYYEGLRWDNWKKDVIELDGNKGIHCFPYLWTEEGKNINALSRHPVPIQELWDLYVENYSIH